MAMKDKVFIGIPCYESVSHQTLEDYMRFAYYLGRRETDYDFYLGVKSKSEQFRARNGIVDGAQTVNAKWLLMLDDDHIIDTEGESGPSDKYGFVGKLIEHNVDIVGPIYYQRGAGAMPVVMKEIAGAYHFLQDSELTNGLQEVAVQGGGCMLIRMALFDKIKQPYFAPEFKYGTDIQLCRAAREKGFKVYTDSSIEIGHVYDRRAIVTSKNKNAYKELAEETETANMVAGWHISSVLEVYKADMMKYLDVHSEKELADLREDYPNPDWPDGNPEHGTTINEQNYEGYYRSIGKPQLARQMGFHYTDDSKMFGSFILTTIQPSNPGIGVDVGCGSAPIGFDLLRRGHEMYFNDIEGTAAYDALKWRVKRYDLEKTAHFQEWPKDGTANYVMFVDALEHMHNWREMIDKATKALTMYGFILTNFLIMHDLENREHVFVDKGEFMKHMLDLGFMPINGAVFQKQGKGIKDAIVTQDPTKDAV